MSNVFILSFGYSLVASVLFAAYGLVLSLFNEFSLNYFMNNGGLMALMLFGAALVFAILGGQELENQKRKEKESKIEELESRVEDLEGESQ